MIKKQDIQNTLVQYEELLIIIVLAVIISLIHPLFSVPSAGIIIWSFWRIKTREENRKKEVQTQIESLSQDFDAIAKHSVFNMPFPLVIVESSGVILWHNTPFTELMDKDKLVSLTISDVIPEISEGAMFEKGEGKVEIKYGDRDYELNYNVVETKATISSRTKVLMIYFVDITEIVRLRVAYKDEQTIVGLLYIDSYEDIKNSTPDLDRPLLMAEIDNIIFNYFHAFGGVVRKYENDKYMVVLNHWMYEQMEERKFELLDTTRELSIGNTMPITLSIGIALGKESILEGYRKSRAAIDIALGRGGDQAVIEENEQLEFYGGKSKAVEKRNKVKSRVIAFAMKQLIDAADNVFVMGHINPDMDAIGSAIGVLRMAIDRDKEGYIVSHGENPSIKNLFQDMQANQPETLKRIIQYEEAQKLVTANSLLVLVDHHKPSLTEYPELLEQIDRIVVFDHHRRGSEFINNPVLTYLEPYASSASELVTEVLSYMNDKITLTKFEAEALLGGITVDTKSFSFKTGVRTFEAASLLKRAGADTTKVLQLFKDDFNSFIYKAEVVQTAKIVKDSIAISKMTRENDESVLIASQSADELLNINGVEASFVLAKLGEDVHISGRSFGSISVQLILERLGGGGHLTSAGARLIGKTLDEAEEILISAIDEYLSEGE